MVGLALVCVAACGKSGSTAPATNNPGNGTPPPVGGDGNPPPANTVDATTSDTFDPSSLSVSVGTVVSFVFASTGHNVTFDAVAGRPPDITGSNSNTTITRTFSTAGTFTYQCTIHSNMTGSITVQ